VIPFAGEHQGIESQIWTFIVKKTEIEIPTFELELELKPNPLEIKPGEIKFVTAIVTNLGELIDNFTVSINDTDFTKLNAEVYKQDTREIAPGASKGFQIMISVKDGSEPGEETITVTAESNLDIKYGLNVEVSKDLVVKILAEDVKKEDNESTNSFYFSILIIILIIVIIIILILVRKRATNKQIDPELILETTSSNNNIEDSLETEPELYDEDNKELEN
jgi:uncharacterized membrane protein